MAAPTKFPTRLKHVQSGEPVSAGVASRPDRVLEGRTNYLKEVFDSIEAGRALILRDQAVAAEVLEGQPVYWDEANLRYDQALAAVDHDLATGSLVAAASADVSGVVLAKKAGNRADIVLWGVVHFKSLDNAVSETLTPGRYYLSGSTAGTMTRSRPPTTVSIGLVFGPLDACESGAWVFVMPQMRDFLEDHIHYSQKLTARPAGDHIPPASGARHAILNADEDLPGWLPADHASFNGRAPAGADFGYNLAAHPVLEGLWPPIPASAAILEMFKPDDGDKVGGRVPASKIQIDQNGIWWMSDCYDEVPWPTLLDTTLSSSSSATVSDSSSSAQSTCPHPAAMELCLSFIKMTFATDKSVVTSLQPEEGQPLEYVNCDGAPAATGELFSRLNLSLLIDPEEALGGQALKGVEDNLFQRGWMTEGLIAGSDLVSLTSDRQRLLDPDSAASPSNPPVHQGVITVDVAADPTERALLPQIAVLGDAVERVYKNIPYLGFPNGRDSELRLKFVIPPEGLPLDPKAILRVVLFGRATGTLTDLDTSYYRLARPESGSPTAITEGDSALVLDTSTAVTLDEAHEFESEEITIEAGDTLYVSIARDAGGSPAYAAEIGLIQASAILVAGGS